MIKGVIPAMVTPFDEKENLDEARLRKVVRFLVDGGVNGLYLTGSTGEAFTMTPDERKQVVEITLDEVGGKIPVIVHVGAIGTKISIDLAQHAEKTGAAAISSVPPFYWKFSEDRVYEYYRDISAETNLPMIVYNIPLAGAVGYSLIKKLAQIPGVEGIKYTLSTHYDIMRMRDEIGPDFAIYSGSDEMAMSGLAFGADGVIGSTYNVISDLYLDIFKAAQEKNLTMLQDKQRIANTIIMKGLEYDLMPLLKRMMAWMGVDAGYSRRPFYRFSEAEEAAIREEFRKFKNLPGAESVRFLQSI